MSGRRLPGWRDRAASELVLRHLDVIAPEAPALVAEDPRPEVVDALVDRLGTEDDAVRRWNRRALGGRPARTWPPVGDRRSCFLRLPRAKEELQMAVHAAASRLTPGGRLIVYGARDEGAASAGRVLEALFDHVHTVATGGRCRLVSGVRKELEGTGEKELRDSLDAWRVVSEAPHPELGPRRWISYPGVFAAGRVDAGTALLLELLPAVDPDETVLDFGCGDGVVAGVVAERTPGLRPLMLDVDAVALEAARENVPAGRPVLGDGWSAWRGMHGREGRDPGSMDADRMRFDLVVANPPYHLGKAETTATIEALIRGSAERLRPGGRLVFVAQRRLPAEPLLERMFGRFDVLGDRGPYRVRFARRR